MSQKEFNNKERFSNLIETAKSKNLGYRFVLEEVRRNRWNINLKQSEKIAEELKQDYQRILQYALEINVLNVDSKTKKVLEKQYKKKE